VYAQFHHPFSNRLTVPEVACLHLAQSEPYARLCNAVA
jgi:hypothetical protein